MNEITKRFEIIRLAIQLGDFETILVQCEKLPEISADEHLNDIIELLKSRSYRQALYEMRYMHRVYWRRVVVIVHTETRYFSSKVGKVT